MILNRQGQGPGQRQPGACASVLVQELARLKLGQSPNFRLARPAHEPIDPTCSNTVFAKLQNVGIGECRGAIFAMVYIAIKP